MAGAASGHDFQRGAARTPKLGYERSALTRRERIAQRVCQHSDAPRTGNREDGGRNIRPLGPDVPRSPAS